MGDISSTNPKWNSPGNKFSPNPTTTPLMRTPSLSFLYRLECDIAKEELNVGAAHSTGVIRSIANILEGEVNGPNIKGKVLPLGGADWATVIEGTHSMTLDARYTVKTDDGHYVFIQAHGLYRPGPDTEYAKEVERNPITPPKEIVTQDDVEFFSHLRLEAGGDGPYNWLNGLVCTGVMCCTKTRIVIDVYYLTNFPDRRPESVLAKRIR